MFAVGGCENSPRLSCLPSFSFVSQNFDWLIAKVELTVIYLAL